MPSEIESTSLTSKPLQQALSQSVAEIHQRAQGVQCLSTAYTSTLTHHRIEIWLTHRDILGKTVIRKGTYPNSQGGRGWFQ